LSESYKSPVRESPIQLLRPEGRGAHRACLGARRVLDFQGRLRFISGPPLFWALSPGGRARARICPP